MIDYLLVQDIITQYVEDIMNDGTDNNYHIGYYHMLTPNEFVFTEREGSKYVKTDFIPCMIEGWNGRWEPLPGIKYIELGLTLTTMVRLNNNKNSVFADLNAFNKNTIGRYDELSVHNITTGVNEVVSVAIGSGIARPLGGTMVWAGERYVRVTIPFDVTFSFDVILGNVVVNKLDGVTLTPVKRSNTRVSDPYPIQLLNGPGNSTKTKRNLNKENVWNSVLTFKWTDSTDFIVNYLNDPDYDQNRTFVHELTLKSATFTRHVNIVESSFSPDIGIGSDISITIMEAYKEE